MIVKRPLLRIASTSTVSNGHLLVILANMLYTERIQMCGGRKHVKCDSEDTMGSGMQVTGWA